MAKSGSQFAILSIDLFAIAFHVLCCLTILLAPSGVTARETTVSAGASIGYEYNDRTYDDSEGDDTTTTTAALTDNLANLDDEDDYNRLRLSPLLDIKSLTARDELKLHYSPSYRYDFDIEDEDVDHDLSLDYTWLASEAWKLKMADHFVKADIVDTSADTTAQLSDTEGRRRYWNNDLNFKSEYSYWADSLFSLGYGFTVFENIDGGESVGYDGFARHSAELGVDHRFDSEWRLAVGGQYVRGLYDETDASSGGEEALEKDLSEYRATTTLEASMLERHPLSLTYAFTGVDYDDSTIASSTLNELTFSSKWIASKDLTVGAGGGPSYMKLADQTGEWGYNGHADLAYSFEHGKITFAGKRGYEWENFTGTSDNGLRKFWEGRLDLLYTISENLNVNLYSAYRDEDVEEITGLTVADNGVSTTTDDVEYTPQTEMFHRSRVSAGVDWKYSFARWYSITIGYSYAQQDSERTDDSYDEHRVLALFSFEKELFQW